MRSWMVVAAALTWLAAAGLSGCGDKLEPAEHLDCPEFQEPARPTFEAHIVGIMAEKCSSCHATNLTGDARNDAPTDVNYDDYWEARVAMPLGMTMANAGVMPPVGYDKLTLKERCTVQAWMDNEYPEQ